MRFSISGEIDHTIGENFRIITNDIRKKLNDNLGTNNYGEAIEVLFLCPMILSFEFQASLGYKERKLYRKKEKATDYRLMIDYNEFLNGDDDGKRRLLIENIIYAIRDLKRKIKKGFDGDKLEADILALFSLKPEDMRERKDQK